MRLDEKIFFHGGWLLGALYVLVGLLQATLGLRFREQTEPIWTDIYPWLGVGMTVSGIAWLLLWYFYWSEFIESSTGR